MKTPALSRYLVAAFALLWLAACDQPVTTPVAGEAVAETSAATAELTLTDTRWKLIELDGQPFAPARGMAFLLLNGKDSRVSGSGGCNRIMGGYTTSGSKLVFGQMAGTMMACPEGMEAERKFLDILAKVNQHRIEDGILILRDGATPLARFEVAPKS